MATTQIHNEQLTSLLNRVKRTQTVGGKSQDQVLSCILKCRDGRAIVTSLVKDGLTSLSRMSIPIDTLTDGDFFITDIDTLLGVLKYHSTILTLEQDGDKLRIKSSNKQTTLSASSEALAFPHNPKTLREWTNTSESIASKLQRDANLHYKYVAPNDEIYASLILKTDALTLYEAFRCDSMNGQKINRYRIYSDTDGYKVETGKILKGQTSSMIRQCEPTYDIDASFEGGLENLLSNYNGDININFFDFSEYGQGWKILFDFGNGDYVFQSSIVE